jgi:hypothetical protein
MFAPRGTWVSSSNQSTTELQGSANNFLSSGILGTSTPITGVTCSSGSGTTTKYTDWVFYTTDGTGHPMPASDYTDDTSGNTSYLTGSGFTGAVAVDGSGLIVSMTANSQLTSEYLKNGMSIGLSSPFKITDSNGNFVEQDVNETTYTDTMGLTSLTTSGRFPTPTFTWTNVSGANVDVALTATSETLGTYFQCTSPSIAELSGSVSLPTGVSYPDGTSLGISYETDPHNSSDVTGRLNKLTLREGGTVSYTYGGSNNGINCTYQTVPTLTRTLGNGDVTTYTLAYANTSGSNYNATNTVKDPGGNQTVYRFSGLNSTGNQAFPVAQVVTEVQRYQGTSTCCLPTSIATTPRSRALLRLRQSRRP